ISTQHNDQITQEELRELLIEKVIIPVLTEHKLLNTPDEIEQVRILTNPTGQFIIGGPVGDSGLTGRKIIVDTFGGAAHHGGGAFSGKDPSKVDRSAAYAARHAAKNIVAAGLADNCEIQLSYAIGVAEPTSIKLECKGTEKVPLALLTQAVRDVFSFSARACHNITLKNHGEWRFEQLASYGHFGRTELNVPWEATDKVDELNAKVEELKSQNDW
ncbi:TPA: methionine adenosyltransferase, partial [Salmonella enterica]|nr:methionine adenosyltransferase [Salmonella enterica]